MYSVDRMTLLIPAGFAHIAFKFQYLEGAEPAITTTGMDLNGASGTFFGVLDLIADAWITHILPAQSNGLVYLGINARISVNGEPVSYDVARNQAGGEASAMLTRNTAILVKKQTNRGGRRGRGRMFIPGLAREVAIDQAGNITPADRNALQVGFNSLFNALNAIGNGPCLLHNDQVITGYSPVTGKPVYGPFPPGPPDNVVAFAVDGRAATQRRRMR